MNVRLLMLLVPVVAVSSSTSPTIAWCMPIASRRTGSPTRATTRAIATARCRRSTASNVKNLQLKWSYHPLYTKNTNAQNKMENSPLVVDGIMYTGTALEVVALDAVTGREYWKLSRPLDPKAYYNAYEVNKGLAIAGDTLFWATVDCHLLAIDAKSGRGDLGQDSGRLQQGLPVQRAAARRAGQGDPRTGDQRSGRQLLGRGVRRQDRERTLALRHRAELRGCARGEDLGRRFVEARRQSDLECRQLRSGNEPDVLGDRQSESGLERRHPDAGRQSVLRLA